MGSSIYGLGISSIGDYIVVGGKNRTIWYY